jgi:hypothetical protein
MAAAFDVQQLRNGARRREAAALGQALPGLARLRSFRNSWWCFNWLSRPQSIPTAGALLQSAPPKSKFKNTDAAYRMISNGLRDLPFSRNQPLELADDSTLEFGKIK